MLTKMPVTNDTSKMVGTTLNTRALSTKFIPLKANKIFDHLHIVACQAHPALVKIGLRSSIGLSFSF